MNDIITITRPHNKIIICDSIDDIIIPNKYFVMDTIFSILNHYADNENIIKIKLIGELSNETGRMFDYIKIRIFFKSNEESLDLSDEIDEVLFRHPHMTRILTSPYFINGDRK